MSTLSRGRNLSVCHRPRSLPRTVRKCRHEQPDIRGERNRDERELRLRARSLVPPIDLAVGPLIDHPLQDMFSASLYAFWTLAQQFNLTLIEQAGLLAVSKSTCQRWRRETPPVNVNALDRLQLVLRTYGSLTALASVSEQEKGRLFRAPGSAESPEDPTLSLLAALSVPSILEMNAHCRRFESLRHAV